MIRILLGGYSVDLMRELYERLSDAFYATCEDALRVDCRNCEKRHLCNDLQNSMEYLDHEIDKKSRKFAAK